MISTTVVISLLLASVQGRLLGAQRRAQGSFDIPIPGDCLVTVTGNSNVPKYTISKGDLAYKVQLSQLYEAKEDGSKIGTTNQALSALGWEFGCEDEEGAVDVGACNENSTGFWMQTTSDFNKLDMTDLKFFNKVNSTDCTIKFDVYMGIINKASPDAAFIDLTYKISKVASATDESDGTVEETSTATEEKICVNGEEFCFETDQVAYATKDGQEDVEVAGVRLFKNAEDSGEGKFHLQYPFDDAFIGATLFHDPTAKVSASDGCTGFFLLCWLQQFFSFFFALFSF